MDRRGRRWFGPCPPWVVLALRLLVVLLTLQTNGFADGVVDVISAVSGSTAPDDDCNDHGDCHCPPGCPNCHTAPATGSLPPAPLEGEPTTAARLVEVSTLAYDDTPPALPDLASVYRPPRSTPCA